MSGILMNERRRGLRSGWLHRLIVFVLLLLALDRHEYARSPEEYYSLRGSCDL